MMRLCLGRQAVYNQERKFKSFQNNEENEFLNSMIFPSNFIKTSRYTFLSFLPLSLLLQFKKYANIYFLVTAVLQCIPAISPLSAYVAVAPLIVVLSVSMLREGFEDYSRHQSDSEQNHKTKAKQVQQDRKEKEVAWADIHVGDMLHIFQDECFPADLLVLGSNLEGVCYIETGALDGEKNLKPKSALIETSEYFNISEINLNEKNLQNSKRFSNKDSNFHLQITARAPDPDPNNFVGSIGFRLLNNKSDNQKEINEIPADQNQFVPRGAFLRNTESIYAVVVYTGMDSKIMKNSEEGEAKTSDMESKMNKFILCILAFQLICSFLMACCYYYWNYSQRMKNLFPYLYLNKQNMSTTFQSVLTYFSYFILFNTMIPISLIVSLEMVKVLQAYFISHDSEMYSAHNDKWPKVLTSTINEQLGQIEYVFSDKTGTLTQNQMQFKMAIIGHQLYGENATKKNKDSNELPTKPENTSNTKHNLSEFIFEDHILSELLALKGDKEDNPSLGITLKSADGKATYQIPSQLDLIKEYFSLLGFTHECIIEKNKNPNDKTISYQGPSPDEITLVDAAYHMGFIFSGKTSNKLLMNMRIGNQESTKEVQKINVFEFSSARKRNTLILKDNGVYKMYVKGADNVIKDRLNYKILQPFLLNADKKLTEFSVVGLRTLLIGMKIMSQEEVDSFTRNYNNLSNSPNRKEDLEKLADDVERGFFLIGATAVEDKLQDKVPESIHDLLRANIKVWMLTGDKLETAENIAKSCKLILEDFELLVMSDKNPAVVKKMMTDVLWRKFKHLKANNIRKCLLVEGDCLKVIFQPGNEDIKTKFVQISKDCESVVCCRVSPVQKAQVVRAIREGLNKITLAIGDGANDVNMIQAAHIGCGIYGNEGMRAVQSSDFAFGQFKCLWRLIFVHGRWSYIRISEMIIYFFYKNMIFTVPQLFFAFFSGFSAQSIFDDYYISLYNLIFTALPLVVRAVFDQDINYLYMDVTTSSKSTIDKKDKSRLQKLLEKRKDYMKDKLPSLYYIGQKQELFSTPIFVSWVMQGFFHGLIVFFLSFWSVGNHIYENDGFTSDQWSFSLIIYTSVVFIANNKLALNTRYWTIFTYLAFYLTSIGLYIAAFFITGQLTSSNVFDTPNYLVQTPHFYLVIFLIVGCIFAFDAAVIFAREIFSDSTKEKSFRTLMNSQPQKNKSENKWEFIGSNLEAQSNIGSFMDKQYIIDSLASFESKSPLKEDEEEVKNYLRPKDIFFSQIDKDAFQSFQLNSIIPTNNGNMIQIESPRNDNSSQKKEECNSKSYKDDDIPTELNPIYNVTITDNEDDRIRSDPLFFQQQNTQQNSPNTQLKIQSQKCLYKNPLKIFPTPHPSKSSTNIEKK